MSSGSKATGCTLRCLKDAGSSTTTPTVTTTAVFNTAQTTASSGGNVTSDGGAAVIARGVCYGTSPNPTISGSHTTDGSGTGTFTSTITGLIANTTYYIRAYATNSVGEAYGNQVTVTTTSSFSIGQSYGGGIICYINGTGNHGLIAAPNDQSSGSMWGCSSTSIPSTSTAIGTGQANTTAIVNGCSTAGISARVCDDLVLNGFSDWFLPSKDELSQMYLQRNLIGGFSPFRYWSSSQGNSYSNSWVIYFDNGSPGLLSKDYNSYVRAVRAF
jgi:hypothetical protein